MAFEKTFKKLTKILGFHLLFKTANRQDFIYTKSANDNNITIKIFYLYLPKFIPSPETQAMFNETIKNNYRNSNDSYTSDRKVINDGLQYQVDISSAQNIKSPKYLIAAHETAVRITIPNKANDKTVFDNSM